MLECALLNRTRDNAVNRVLKFTLHLCKTSLHSFGRTGLETTRRWASACEEMLCDVTEMVDTKNSDYSTHGLSGFYKEHRHLLLLAKAIRENSMNMNDRSLGCIKTVPFLVNTWYLFERWVAAVAAEAAKEMEWNLLPAREKEQKLFGDHADDANHAEWLWPKFDPDLKFEAGPEIRASG